MTMARRLQILLLMTASVFYGCEQSGKTILDRSASGGSDATRTARLLPEDAPERVSMARLVAQSATDSDRPRVPRDSAAAIRLEFLGRYASGVYKQSGAEIVAFDAASKRAFVVNAFSGKVDVLELMDPAQPKWLFAIDVSDIGADANSVAVKQGRVAIAVAARIKTDPGYVAFYNVQGQRQSVVEVGALPDAVTFSPDGRYLLVANEGEPNDDYAIDPEGSVSIIDISGEVASLKQTHVRTADFRSFNGREDELRARGVRIYGPGSTAAQDFEPEWIEVTSDSRTAYVCLQENNAVARVDISTATVSQVMQLGFKDWSARGQWSGQGFDASDRDGGANLRHWPVFGMFQPDTVKLIEVDGATYLIGANEGDAREWGNWSEEARVAKLRLDPVAFPDAAELQKPENLGRLVVTTTMGVANDCDPSAREMNATEACVYNALYAFGGRSMAIWRVTEDSLELVYDTGSQMEETTAQLHPKYFNADHQDQERQLDKRSTSKGPEPEGMAVGMIDGRTYAFVGLERVGGIMVYDVTNPLETKFIQYINTRDFAIGEDATADHTQADLGSEGLCFVPGSESPDAQGRPLLIVGNEVSGTTAVFVIETR